VRCGVKNATPHEALELTRFLAMHRQNITGAECACIEKSAAQLRRACYVVQGSFEVTESRETLHPKVIAALCVHARLYGRTWASVSYTSASATIRATSGIVSHFNPRG
jgi:hypothetical protein